MEKLRGIPNGALRLPLLLEIYYGTPFLLLKFVFNSTKNLDYISTAPSLTPAALRASVRPWILGKENLKNLLVFKFVGLMRLSLCFEYLKQLIFFHNIFKKQKKKIKQNRKIKKGERAKEKVTSMTAPPSLTPTSFHHLGGTHNNSP